MIYNMSGIPCSDELYHHGILGQKWGVRRYQNPDGTLTVAGKIHYGAQKAGESIGNTAKKAANKIATNYKNKHPSLLSDDELRERMNRINLENQYRNMLRENQKPVSKGAQVAQNIMERAGQDLVSGLVSNTNAAIRQMILNNIQEDYDESVRERKKKWDEQDYLRDKTREEARYQRDLSRNESEYQRDRKRRDSEDRKRYQTELIRKKASDAEAKREYDKSLVGQAQKDFETYYNKEKAAGRNIPTRVMKDYNDQIDTLKKIMSPSGNGNKGGGGNNQKGFTISNPRKRHH